MKMMKPILTKLLLSIILLCAAKGAHAATEVAISGGDGNPAIHRIAAFGVTLSASVLNPPEDSTEATISGPTWQWIGGGSGLSLLGTKDTSSVVLSSSTNPVYGGGGQKSVSITCVAVFTSTDRKSGDKSFIPFRKSKDIKFFVRVPARVIQLNHTLPNDVLNGPDLWGHNDTFLLGVRDNQDTNTSASGAQPYGFGLIEESFSDVLDFGPLHRPSTWRYNGGDYNDPDSYSPVYQFTDYVGWGRTYDPQYDSNRIVDGWTQKFTSYERSNPSPGTMWDLKTPLNSHRITNYYQKETGRVVN